MVEDAEPERCERQPLAEGRRGVGGMVAVGQALAFRARQVVIAMCVEVWVST
ncbi:hypothetical protein ACF1HJ_33405 [Streptomyces sp. NPDC013978]|uniref:hypothetical protein n=1 Tax=Streptomyces sp. NPDC013978 TaxID=3364869 RepID=UPI0036FDFF19